MQAGEQAWGIQVRSFVAVAEVVSPFTQFVL